MSSAFAREGGYGGGVSVINNDSGHADHIIVADAQLLFTADFRRAGPDLILTGHDGQRHIIPGYFASENRAALVAPNGASLSPDLIELLAGSPTPGQYAQAQPGTPPDPIGKVEKVVGDVTVSRNGVAVALNVGDAIYKSDVIQTGLNSSVGIAFPDGTALNLVANTRMALNEYSYDANSTSNVALFDLVEGGLSFVAGKVAHTGDMKIGTPVAQLGIRGTAGWLYEEQVATVTANVGNVTLHFAAVFDQVTNTESTYTLYAIDSNGQLLHSANGDLVALATVSSTQAGLVTTLTANGIGSLPSIATAPADITQQQFAQTVVPQVINMAIQAIQEFQQQHQNNQQNTPNPQSPSSNPGSAPAPPNQDNGSTNPNSANPPPQTENIPVPTVGGPVVDVAVTVTPTQQVTVTPPTIPTGSISDAWEPSSGTSSPWNAPTDWSSGVPGPTDNAQDNSLVPAVINDIETVQNLIVGTGATVAVVSNSDPSQASSLTVAGTADVAGMVRVDSTVTDPSVTFSNGLTVAIGGEIEAHGSAASVYITGSSGVDNLGTIIADNGGAVLFSDVEVANGSNGIIEATDVDSLVTLSHVYVSGGILETGDPSTAADGEIEISAGIGSNLSVFDGSANPMSLDAYVQVDDGVSLELIGSINNAGTIVMGMEAGAELIIDGPVTLSGSGSIILEGSASVITGAGNPTDALTNAGNIISGSGTIEDLSITNQSDGILDFTGPIMLDSVSITGGQVTIESGVTATSDNVTLDNVALTVDSDGTTPSIQIDADDTLTWAGASSFGGPSAIIIDDNGQIIHTGTLSISFPQVTFEGSGTVTENGGNTSTEPQILINKGNTFDGFGQMGDGNVEGGLTIENLAGTFDGDVPGQTLFLDTGKTIINDGTFLANGGILDVADPVTGTGSAMVENGGTLELGSSDAQAVMFDDASTLKLDQPADFTGPINGLAVGDIIDLTRTTITSTSLVGSTLTVTTESSETPLTYQVAGALAGSYFAIQSDHAGGDELILTPIAGAASAANSSIAAAPGTVTANGTATTTLTVTAEDANGNPIAGDSVVLSATGSSNTFTPISGVTNSSGVFTATLDSTLAQDETVKALIGGTVTETTGVDFVPGPVAAAISSVTASPGTVTANGTATTTLTVTAEDANGNPIAGDAVVLTATGTGNTFTTPIDGTTNASGVFTTTLAAASVQDDTFHAVIAGTTINETATVDFVPGPVSAATSSIAASPGTVTANGTATTTLTVTAEDANGNLISGATVTLSATGSSNTFTPISGTTNASGVFTATLDSTVAQDETVKAVIAGTVTETTGVDFVPGPVAAATSSIIATPGTVIANGTATTTLTVTAEDANGNLISGATVTLSATGSSNTFTPISGTTNTSGVFTATLDSTFAQDETVKAVIAGTVTETTGVDFVAAGPQTDEWLNTAGGAWTDTANAGTNWSDGALPRSVDSVLLNQSGSGPYIVTIPNGASATAASLTLDSGNATLSDQGTLTLNSALTIDAGTFQLSGSGTLSGETSISNAGTFVIAGSDTLATSITNTNGTVQVDAGDTLTLNGGSIAGGAIDLGPVPEAFQSISEISVPGLDSAAPVMSGSGQFIVFIDGVDVPQSHSGLIDPAVELYNTANDQLTDISALVPGADLHPGEEFNNPPSISENGQYVLFEGQYQVTSNNFGNAPNSGPNTNSYSDIFVYDTQSQAITLVASGASEGGQEAAISGNGQFVAAEFTNTQTFQDYIVVTGDSGVVTQITGDPNFNSQTSGSYSGDAGSVETPDISPDGNYVSFWSTASQIAVTQDGTTTTFNTGNTAETIPQVYVYDRQTNTLQMVSVNSLNQQGNANSGTVTLGENDNNGFQSSLSANGTYVVFQSAATNLVPDSGAGPENGESSLIFDAQASNIYLYDTQTSTITLVSAGLSGAAANGTSYDPVISADGNFVSFESTATNLVAGGTDGQPQTYVYDVQTGTIQLASLTADGASADGESDLLSSLSADGSIVAFGSVADNLVGPDTNGGTANVFIVDDLNQSSLTPAGAIDVTTNAAISGGATLTGGALTVATAVMLTISDVILDGTAITDNGTIAVTASSEIENGTITGGQITIAIGQMLTLDDVVLDNVAIIDNGAIAVDSGETLTWLGTDTVDNSSGVGVWDNDGHIVYVGTLTNNFTTVTFEGSGTVTRDGGSATSTTAGLTLTNEGNTFDGYGTQGNVTSTLINEEPGTVDADFSVKPYILEFGTIANAGILEATDGATLEIENSTVADTGTILAALGSQIELLDTTISSGTLTDNGLFNVAGSSTVDDGAVLTGGEIEVQNNQTLTLNNATLDDNTIVAPAAYTFTSVADPSAAASDYGFSGQSLEINNAGMVVGNYGDSSGNFFGFIDGNGSYTTVSDPLAVQNGFSQSGTTVTGINSGGTVVGYYQASSGGYDGFVDNGGTYTTFNAPLAPESTFGLGINNSGGIVGVVFIGTNQYEGFIDNNGTYTDLQDPSAAVNYGTYSFAINTSGQVLGDYYDVNDDVHGFTYSNGTYTDISDPLAAESASGGGVSGTHAMAINTSGQVVGYYVDANGQTHGFIYSGGSYTTLDDPSAVGGGTVADGINDAGEIVGYYYDANGNSHIFTYDNGVYSNVNDPSSNSGGVQSVAINNAGQIAAVYYSNGGQENFLISPAQGPAGALDITGSSTLDNVDMTGGEVIIASGVMLTLDGGSSTLDNVDMTGGGVTIASGVTLTADGTTVTGSTITELGTITTTGTVKIDGGKTLTLAGTDAITGGLFAIVIISPQAAAGDSVFIPSLSISDLTPGADPSVILTIQASSGSFAAVSGSGLIVNQSGDEITITGDLTDINNALDKGITYTPVGTSNTLTISVTDGLGDTAFRTLSLNTTNPASPTTQNISASGEINNAGLIDITGTTTLSSDALFNIGATVKVEANEHLTLDDTKIYNGTITDNSTIEIAGFSAIVNASLNIGAGDQVTIDPTATLGLTGATMMGGTINDGTSLSGATIDVTSNSEIENASLNNGVVTIASGVTLTINSDTVTGTTFAFAVGATIDLAGIIVTGTAISGSMLTVTESGGSTLTYTVAAASGSLAYDDFTDSSDGHGGTDLTLEPIGYLWGTSTVAAPSDHLYGANLSATPNTTAEAAALVYGSTPSASYNSAGNDSVTENVVLLDPFVLPYDSSPLSLETSTILNLPVKNKVIFPSASSGPEAIAIYETENTSGDPILNQTIIGMSSGPNGSLTPTSTVIENQNLPGAIYTLDVSSAGSPTMTSYAVAWDLSTASSYSIYLAVLPSSGSGIPLETVTIPNPISGTNPALEAWDFRSAGALTSDGVSVPYAFVMAQAAGAKENISFQAYNANGTAATGANYLLTPDIPTGATNQIVEPDTAGQIALQYTPNGVSGSGYSVAWSESVTPSSGPTYYQVEFAIFHPNTENSGGTEVSGSLVTQQTFQVPDAQNVRVVAYNANGVSVEYLAYGDATSTTVVEFNQSGQELASVTDSNAGTAHASEIFNGLGVLEDGRIALSFGDGTSQYTTDIYDLRTTGLDNPTLSTTSANYVAGTEFADIVTGVTGATGVDNFYYYVGQNTSSLQNTSGPLDTFDGGGSATSWNEAVFADAASDYNIVANANGTYTISYTNAADLHSGSLTVNANVQALAFAPSQDPSPVNGALDITSGETLAILTGFGSGAAYPVNMVTFEAGTGTLLLEQPSNFHGTIIGFAGTAPNPGDSDTIDLVGINYDSPGFLPTYNAGQFTVTDGTDSASFTFDGFNGVLNYASDGNGGTLITDPSATATIVSGGSLDLNAPSNETVTFTGGTGSLVLNDPEDFAGQIIGFTGTAPNAADSDTVDLVGINYDSPTFTESYNSSTGLLTVADGSNTASLTFDDFNATLDFASDGNGGTLITDPPAAGSSGTTASAAGADYSNDPLVSLHNDSFVFNQALGAEAGASASMAPHVDAHDQIGHPDAQLAQQLAALVTPDPHHEGFEGLIHNDSLASPSSVTVAQWHEHLANAFHLH
jgi:probable HAF family extracellular repeat protein